MLTQKKCFSFSKKNVVFCFCVDSPAVCDGFQGPIHDRGVFSDRTSESISTRAAIYNNLVQMKIVNGIEI